MEEDARDALESLVSLWPDCADRGGDRSRTGSRLAPCDRFRGIVRSLVRQDRPLRPYTSSLSLPSSGPPHPMPFVRYLRHDGREVSQDDNHQFDPTFSTHLPSSNENGGQLSSSHVSRESPPLQFQLPYFMALCSSTLAPGGGAEVLPFPQVQPTGDPSPNWRSSPLFPSSSGDQ